MPEASRPAESAIDRIQADPRLRSRDDSGVAAIAIGTVLWTLAWVGLLLAGNRWADADSGRWTAIAAAGAGLGLIGLAIVLRRRSRLRRRG